MHMGVDRDPALHVQVQIGLSQTTRVQMQDEG
jgi:hypothetical protein